MKASVHGRLKKLEQLRATALQPERHREEQEQGRIAIEKMEGWLHLKGIERQPHESLAETVARASGITGAELRQELIDRAAGRI